MTDPVLDNPTIDALRVTGSTLLGVGGKFPYSRGNCFSVDASDGNNYRIVNFNLENLQGLKQYGIDAPWKIRPIGSNCAIVVDSRIPEECYDGRFCEVCTPDALLPTMQLLRIQRALDNGSRKEYNGIISMSSGPTLESIGARPPMWKTANWATEPAPELSVSVIEEAVKSLTPKVGCMVPNPEWDDTYPEHLKTFGLEQITDDVWVITTRLAYHLNRGQ